MNSHQAKALALWYKGEISNHGVPAYLHDMIERMQKIDDLKTEKIMRWLGFVQGVLYAVGQYTVEDLKRHSINALESEKGEKLSTRIKNFCSSFMAQFRSMELIAHHYKEDNDRLVLREKELLKRIAELEIECSVLQSAINLNEIENSVKESSSSDFRRPK